MRVLVAGGAGYIGSITVEQLILAGHHVVVVDSLRLGRRGAVHPAATFVQADLHDTVRLTDTLRDHGVEAVMDFAADSLVGQSMQQPEQYFHNNVGGTLSLLRAMLAAGVRRFVFSSTAAVYGIPDHDPIPESAPLRPINPYGESKLMVETMLRWFDQLHGLRSACLRYFNACGASDRFGEDHRPESHLIPLVLQVALGQREHVAIYGTDYPTPDSTCIRDYVHVIDLAQAHIQALDALAERSVTYNLGSSHGYSVREIIDACRRVTGHPIPAVEGPRRAGDPPRLVADSARIRADLGWQPRFTDLDEVVATAWRWHQAHPRGYPA
ncbi:MAG: UDP-glucose 4-epimerase GalE [Chloroflexi bacterium]|nr:UDP-glucose 4-epimerase GalE [Chloroflexota bacterium]